MPSPAKPSSAVRLTAGDAVLTVLPHDGCRMGSLRLGGMELLRTTAPDPYGYGCFPMVPWAGRIAEGQFLNGGIRHRLPRNTGQHAIYGTGVDRAWHQVVAATTETSAAFYYDLGDPWPYSGRVTQVFELAPDSVSVTLCVETYDESFPAQAGWHPWFRRSLEEGGPEAVLDLSPLWQEERGPDKLLTGRRIDPPSFPLGGGGGASGLDDCFGVPDGLEATVTWPGSAELRITSPVEWVVLHDQQPDALCVEPQSGPPNGLNTAPRLVTPIDPLEVGMTWHWRRL